MSSAMRRHSDTPAAISRLGPANSSLRRALRVIAASRKVHRAALLELSSNIDNSLMANAATEIPPQELEMRERRREAMAVLTCSTAAEIARHLAAIDPIPAHSELRA